VRLCPAFITHICSVRDAEEHDHSSESKLYKT